MLFDDDFHIVHARVAYFQRILVEDFVVLVSGWKLLSDEAEKFSGDVRFDVQAVGGLNRMIFLSLFSFRFGAVLHGSYFIT